MTVEPRFTATTAVFQTRAARLARNRRIMLTLASATALALLGGMGWLLSLNGWALIEVGMLAAFAVTLPVLCIGLWNAIVGIYLMQTRRDPAGHVTPQLRRARTADPILVRTALIMPIRNESAEASVARFEAAEAELSHTPWAEFFDYHVLSDSNDPAIIAREEQAVAEWRSRAPNACIHYRRRTENSGFKAGNVAEFVRRCRDDYEFFLPFDADSVMGANAVLRLVRVMQASPEIGILQGLVVGTPSKVFFTRAFQFGMRHGMRAFTLGSAWWLGESGPYWGHNALIRMRAFHDHCLIGPIPGKGVLSGDIMSHDNVEAALMRRAGYECRVVAEEDESYEENPPSLPDFIKRELRWCNGNMQYFKLIGMPGLTAMSRMNLAFAILMYLSPVAWWAMILMGLSLPFTGSEATFVPAGPGLTFLAVILTVNFMPKLMGILQALLDPEMSRAYGGRLRLLAGVAVEMAISILMSPAVAFAVTLGALRIVLGRRMSWDAQQRERARLRWSEAARSLWPQAVAGVAMAAYLWVVAPGALWIAAPMLASLALAVPLAVIWSTPALGRLSVWSGLFRTPEDRDNAAKEPGRQILQAA